MLTQLVVLICSLVMAIAFAVVTFSFPSLRQDPAGLAMFPRALCFVLGLCALIQLGLIVSRPAEFIAGLKADLSAAVAAYRARLSREEEDAGTVLRRMVFLFILSIAYAWLIVRAGFLVSTILYMFALLRLLRARLLVSGIIAVVVSSGVYIVFSRVLHASVPEGVWWYRLFPWL